MTTNDSTTATYYVIDGYQSEAGNIWNGGREFEAEGRTRDQIIAAVRQQAQECGEYSEDSVVTIQWVDDDGDWDATESTVVEVYPDHDED